MLHQVYEQLIVLESIQTISCLLLLSHVVLVLARGSILILPSPLKLLHLTLREAPAFFGKPHMKIISKVF
jgi:hypothetical protein